MLPTVDTSSMALAVLIFIVVIGPLAIAFGADSRLDERANRRRWPA
jgi:hypothetical protein